MDESAPGKTILAGGRGAGWQFGNFANRKAHVKMNDDQELKLNDALNQKSWKKVQELIDHGQCTRKTVLWTAASDGHDFCLPFLLASREVSDDALTALWRAADEGQSRCVEVIVQHVNLTEGGGDALKTAARGGGC